MDTLSYYFLPEAFLDRARRRSSTSARSILEANREELMQLTRKKKG
ncbi:hypothetical protein PQR14_19955 [Paraburkholderia bryophila]